MSLLTTLLFPKRTPPPPGATQVIDTNGANRQGNRPAALMKAKRALEQRKEPVTLVQLMEIAGVSRATAARALKEFGEVAGAVPTHNARGVRAVPTYLRRTTR